MAMYHLQEGRKIEAPTGRFYGTAEGVREEVDHRMFDVKGNTQLLSRWRVTKKDDPG